MLFPAKLAPPAIPLLLALFFSIHCISCDNNGTTTTPVSACIITNENEYPEFAIKVVSAFNEVYPLVTAIISNRSAHLAPYPITILPTDNSPAKATGVYVNGHIQKLSMVLNLDYFSKQDDKELKGVLSHELFHFCQYIEEDINPVFRNFIVEGSADFCRWKITGPFANCLSGGHYTKGYTCGAVFLDYLERSYFPADDVLFQLNEAIHTGSPDDSGFLDAFLVRTCGKSAENLWAEYLSNP